MSANVRHRVIAGRVLEIPNGVCPYCLAESQRSGRRAPAFHCDRCKRHIGRKRSVCLINEAGPVIWCLSCREGDGSSKWWDEHQPIIWGSQAGIRAYLRGAR